MLILNVTSDNTISMGTEYPLEAVEHILLCDHSRFCTLYPTLFNNTSGSFPASFDHAKNAT